MRFWALAALLLTGCASLEKPVADLAPTGRLRVAINYGNAVLASRDASGKPQGVSVDLATELGRRLGVPVEFLAFDAAGKVVDAARFGIWDVAFVALDPRRAQEIEQSTPYLEIEGAYLVREGSPIRQNSEVDRPGVRVVVGRGSAYDLFLSRSLKQAQLVRSPTTPQVVEVFLSGNHEVAANVKQQLQIDMKKTPGLRLLPGRFMVIHQAMATQKGKEAGARYVRDFVEDAKASGFVAQALARHRIEGVAVAPKGAAVTN